MAGRWWWPFGRDDESTGTWRCGERHPVYEDARCKRSRKHKGQHLNPETGYWE